MRLAMRRAMRALHDEQTIFSRRHMPSWLLLAAAGGAVNAIGFVAGARFVSHATGAISTFGIHASGGRLALESAVILGCLVLGAMSAMPLTGAKRHALPLVVVASILTVLAVLGTAGAFGEFGSDDESRPFLFLSALSFAMGLKNATVAAATRLIVRTTHMTGAATDLGLHLSIALRSHGDVRRTALHQAALRAGKMAAFMAGAAVGAALASSFGFLALACPVLAIAYATFASFTDHGDHGACTRARKEHTAWTQRA